MRYFIVLVVLLFALPCYANNPVYILGASVQGGDTTTIYVDTDAVAPSHPTYGTIEDALAYLRTNNSGVLDTPHVIEVSGSTADTSNARIYSTTTTSTNTLTIKPAATDQHGGYWDDTKYKLAYNGTNYSGQVGIEISNVVIDGIQIRFDAFGTSSGDRYGVVNATSGNANITIRNNIIRSDVTTWGFGIASTVGTAIIYNNIVIGGSRGASLSGSPLFYSNTIVDSALGVRAASTDIVAINNILWGVATAFNGTPNSTSDHNLTDLSSLGYTANTNDIVSATGVFTSAGSGDYSLETGSPAVDAGSSLGSPYNVDMVGTARPQGSSYDIGALEK